MYNHLEAINLGTKRIFVKLAFGTHSLYWYTYCIVLNERLVSSGVQGEINLCHLIFFTQVVVWVKVH